MSKFESAPEVPPVQIVSFRRVRKRFKHGDTVGDEPRVYDDLFTNLAPGSQVRDLTTKAR